MLVAAGVLPAEALDVKDFTFSHLSKTDGAENQKVFSICRVPTGALWWSSKTGVCRYNGSQIVNYRLEQEVLYGNQGGRVINLTTGSSSLYAFDNRGFIFVFNTVQNRFEQVASLSDKIGHEVALNDVYVNGAGEFYLAMHNGVFMLRDTVLTPLHQGVWVNRIIKVKDRLYYLTREGVLDTDFKKILPYNTESGYYDYNTGRLWLGGYESGLNVVTFDDAWNVLTDDFVRIGAAARQNPIRSICPYDDVMLIGVDGLGVYQMAREGGVLEPRLLFDANDGANGVLHGNGIYSIVVDDWKNIVIGSYAGGIDIARPNGGTVAVFRHQGTDNESLPNGHVNTVMELRDGLLMMGTDNGIGILDVATQRWTRCCEGVVALNSYKTPDSKVLVSTYGKGVYEIDYQGNARQIYTTGNVLKDDHVYATCHDRSGNLWIGCLIGDLVRLAPDGSCSYYSVTDVQRMLLLSTGEIAVGTAFGLKVIEPESGVVTELMYAPHGVDDYNPFVTDMMEDGSGRLWIATDGGGVYIYDMAAKSGVQLTVADGLPTNYVSSIVQDTFGRVWIATEEGLAFVEDGKVVSVNYCYGLDCEYSHGAAARLSGGDIFYGTTDGALIMHPEHLGALDYTANIRILRVGCEADDPEEFNRDVAQMLEQGEIHLGYNQRTFIIYFESVNMRYHYDIAYRYKVEGGQWSEPSDYQYVRFVNLEPGRHELVIQAVSRTSGEVIDTKTLGIVISQPWWNTWQMWLVYLALLALVFYGVWRVYKLQAKYMRLSIEYMKLSNLSTPEDVAFTAAAQEEQESASDDTGKEFVDKATGLIMERLSDTEFTINDLCREMAMSRTLFYVKLKTYTGKSPQDFIRIIRLERAASLLRSGSTVADAAAMTGFDNPKYFSTVFKKYFDLPPSKYQ